MTVVQVDVLVVGTGPSGGTTALALARSGVRVMVVNRYGWTCRTPRAHATSPRTQEVLADLGVLDDAKRYAAPNDMIGETVFCESLHGREYGRVQTAGSHPDVRARFAQASPELPIDLPQNYMEAILVGAAAHAGAQVLFNTEFERFEQDDDGVTSHLRDRITGQTFEVRSRYLVGADGANSRVAEQAGLPIAGERAKGGAAANIVINIDLTHLVAHRPGVLYWVIQPGDQGPYFVAMRMVRPWNKWLITVPWNQETDKRLLDEAYTRDVLKKVMGDPSLPFTVESTSFWTVNEQWATQIQNQRVLCMGDAIHRHPPFRGLGSNTSIQDGFNLAWKLALVVKGVAAPSLLESYQAERLAIAEQVVKAAFGGRSILEATFGALMAAHARGPAMSILTDNDAQSTALRAHLRDTIVTSHGLYDCPGVDTNYRYVSNAAWPGAGEAPPAFTGDPWLRYQPTTYPGARLPHAWVFSQGKKMSVLSLCGNGRFTLLTGNSGLAWREAVRLATAQFGLDIDVRVIGMGQAYEDLYGDYAGVREVAEDGAVLVRPDHHVAWRAQTWTPQAPSLLVEALARLLGRDAARPAGAQAAAQSTRAQVFDEMNE